MTACGGAQTPATTSVDNQSQSKAQPVVAATPVPASICTSGHEINATSRFFAGRDASGATKLFEVTPDANLMDAPNMYFDPTGKYLGNAAGGEMPDDPAIRERIWAHDKQMRAGLTFVAVDYQCTTADT